MPVNLEDIRRRREERRQAQLAAAKEEEGSNGAQPPEQVEEEAPAPAPVMERRRRTTRDAAVAERKQVEPETVATKEEPPEEEELVDVVQTGIRTGTSSDGKWAVYEAPKPEVLTASDDPLLSKVEAIVRRAIREEFSRLHIRFDLGAQSQIHDLAADAGQMLAENVRRIEKPPKQQRQQRERQPESAGYKAFKAEWRALDHAGRVAKAKAVGAKWEKHPDERIDAMRMQVAVREAMGVEKYS